ncbi:MAG: hypothetical protein ACI8SJ_001001, partial [Shewanella sp.]
MFQTQKNLHKVGFFVLIGGPSQTRTGDLTIMSFSKI